ncbi:hypothetical protein EMCG_05989 [[Emmonsia] crescens]|uniref:Uncharacterized protein n=1 Tax=[Emmonsia] crescens TaxID=73230 RepID=A0A0G2J795_9EURO|nr:hypothetical protein EMCG_05989 [Emmonsia crescens UAMH 3008]
MAAILISPNWIKKNLLTRLKSKKEDPAKVAEDFERYLEVVWRPEHISASTLEDDVAVMSMLKLSYSQEESVWRLHETQNFTPSQLLLQSLEELRYVVSGSPSNEAYIRCAINLILVSCISEEKRLAEVERLKDVKSQPALHPSSRPTTPDPPAPVSLQFETKLSFPVEVHGQTKLLVGKADYALWYNTEEDMGTNLLVVEAKKKFFAYSAIPQLIAYMGIVHQQRKLAGRRNAVVYGIASDSYEFRFLRLDNNSKLSKSPVYDWVSHAADIVSYIRFTIRAAILESPSTSPYSGEKRETTLAAYEGNSQRRFDYITLPGDFVYGEPDDPPDMVY